MATKTAKKTTRKTTAKTTARKAEQKSINDQILGLNEVEKKAKSCAYPSCSARATQEFGDNNVPSCDHHANIFETQANDGAGIQQLMENYKG